MTETEEQRSLCVTGQQNFDVHMDSGDLDTVLHTTKG